VNLAAKNRTGIGYWCAGTLIAVAAFISYPLLFSQFPITRDVPWVNFLLFGIALVLFVGGLQKASGSSITWRTWVGRAVLGVVSVVALWSLCFMVFYKSRQLPPSTGSPQVGQKAPEFELQDVNNQAVTLAELLSAPIPGTKTPPKGVLLVFYRGYW
jgi:hypothetical protein